MSSRTYLWCKQFAWDMMNGTTNLNHSENYSMVVDICWPYFHYTADHLQGEEE